MGSDNGPEPLAPMSAEPRRGTLDMTNSNDEGNRFACNICLDAVSEPVVTRCGHLYCWPCLYRWLEPGMLPHERPGGPGHPDGGGVLFNESRRCCPVCKANCTVPTLVPIYIRNIDPPAPSTDRTLPRTHTLSDASNRTLLMNNSHDTAEEVVLEGEPGTFGIRRRRRATVSAAESAQAQSGDDNATEVDRTNEVEVELESEPNTYSPVDDPDLGQHQPVPSRPMPPPARPLDAEETYLLQQEQQRNVHHRHHPHLSPNFTTHRGGNPSSLSNGLAMALQRTLFPEPTTAHRYYQTTHNATPTHTSGNGIPPIHRHHHNPASSHDDYALDPHNAPTPLATPSRALSTRFSSSGSRRHDGTDPVEFIPPEDTTIDFLSRLLLLLGSFVILCLLLF
eukprot:scaffold27859_cov55-Attheya_sp.AAC.2